jgi:hypothetical protein
MIDGCVNRSIYALTIAAVTCLLTLSSCKKDHLTHRAEVLVGEWKCERVLLIKSPQPPFIEGDTILWLDEESIDLQMKFTERGKVILERDGKCLGRSRVRSWTSQESSFSGLTSFSLNCPGFSDNLLTGPLTLVLIANNKFFTNHFSKLLQTDVLSQGERFEYLFIKLD